MRNLLQQGMVCLDPFNGVTYPITPTLTSSKFQFNLSHSLKQLNFTAVLDSCNDYAKIFFLCVSFKNVSVILCMLLIILCVLIRIGTLFYITSKAISLAISCVLKQIEKPDKKQLSLRFYPYENLLFLVEKLLHPRSCNCGIYEVKSRGKWETGFSILKFIDASAILYLNEKLLLKQTNVFKDKI
ncbi:hypothetical protein T01_8410 [Trichinella spiralis]|uniref:Uncharacterized protein n=1 Tax=Trichinella spiralis TaxID=6334 RepID=A0A0V1BIN5_TRISP|nr:hypothetical protein T01_8410 [Trichinella spiralis]